MMFVRDDTISIGTGMADLEFLGTLHRSLRQMHDAIAEEWLTASGLLTPPEDNLMSPPSLSREATDAIDGLGLHELQGFDPEELAAAFARLSRQPDLFDKRLDC
jgi:hypothetical protein